MNELFHTNRLEGEVNEWKAREENLKKLFQSSPSIENSLLKEKLRWYEDVLQKYGDTVHVKERLVLRIIKREHSKLVMEFYPNRLAQFAYYLMHLIIKVKITARIQKREELKYTRILRDELQRAGFKNAFTKVERYMNLGKTTFTVPVSYYLNEKERIDHSLSFIKDEFDRYQFNGFKTNLYDESKKGEGRQHFFNPGEADAKQAYELLSGRAVLHDGSWKQLDLNDKDAEGNYRVKDFPASYGYRIEDAIEQLPIHTLDQLGLSELSYCLKNGAREKINLVKDDKLVTYFIEANPQRKGLTIYNERFKEVSLAELRGQRLAIPNRHKQNVKSSLPQNKTRQVKAKVYKII